MSLTVAARTVQIKNSLLFIICTVSTTTTTDNTVSFGTLIAGAGALGLKTIGFLSPVVVPSLFILGTYYCFSVALWVVEANRKAQGLMESPFPVYQEREGYEPLPWNPEATAYIHNVQDHISDIRDVIGSGLTASTSVPELFLGIGGVVTQNTAVGRADSAVDLLFAIAFLI